MLGELYYIFEVLLKTLAAYIYVIIFSANFDRRNI